GGSAGTVGCSGNDKGGGGGGAGGTSDAATLTSVTMTQGVNLGNGSVELCYIPDSADLGITKTDGVTSVNAGGSTTYYITASNAGPAGVVGATVADTFPASLTCAWTCVGSGGGTCTASGSGNINDTVNLPAGGTVLYTATCGVAPTATGTLTNTATVNSGVTDPAPGNNSATDTDTIVPLTYVVTGAASPVAGGSVNCTSPVNHAATTSCSVTPNAGYVVTNISGCGGTAGTTSPYATGAITAACTVTATFGAIVNGVCGAANGVPTGVGPVNLCTTGTPSVLTAAVGQFTWTCDGVNGGTNASCAAPRQYMVTPSVSGGNGTATGGGAVVYNTTGSVTITPNAGFFTTTPIGGTCGGTLAGGTFTTSPVTADCTVIASFTAQITPSVSPSPVAGGSLSCTPQAAIGGTSTCTATASPGYVVSAFSGCGGVQTGSTTYVTAPLSAACTVTVLFVPTAVIPVLTGWWAWFLAAFVAFAAFITVRRRGVSLR
ncbi:MAG: DUF11 domain-containing protein, partial [Casimicrobium sp.]